MEPGRIRVIDSHVHVGKWEQQTAHGRVIEPFKGKELDSLPRIQKYLDRYQIERAVFVPIYCPDPNIAFNTNKTLVLFAQQSKGRIVPGFWVDPSPQVRHLLDETINLATDWKIRVLKTSPDAWAQEYTPDPSTWDSILAKGVKKILEYAYKNRAIIQIHTGSGKSDIRIVEKFIRYAGSEIIFHLVHMGRTVNGHFYMIPRFSEWILEGFNIFCDTSLACGFAVRWLLCEAITSAEVASRILFASDEPWGSFDSEFSKIINVNKVEPAILQKVLWDNANLLYKTWKVA